MTDGAKKEQKKALKKIKTTIQKTGSRLAVAGTAAASRQQSRKTRTEKVGTSGNPRKKMSSSVKKAAKEAFDIHPILDAVGFVPVLGEPADFVNGLIYASEEDYINAGLSMAAVIPVIGEAGKMTKYGAKAIEKSKGLKKIGKSVTKPLSKKSSKIYQAGKKNLKKTADDIMDVGSKGGTSSIKSADSIFGSSTKSKQKLMSQMDSRGWSEELLNNTVDNLYTIRISMNKATGNPATVFYTQRGSYVIVDDITKQIVQISDNINPSTWVPDTSIVDPYISK